MHPWSENKGDKIIARSRQYVIFSLALIFFSCRQQPGLPIDFFKEDLTIELDSGQAKVTGIYYFKNLTRERKRVILFYPFLADTFHLYPNAILLDLPFRKDSSGIYFELAIGSRKKEQFKISYTQKLKRTFFRYITTTTKQWQRPIKQAAFTVITPERFNIKTSYPVTEKNISRGKCYYHIKIDKFYPDKDLLINW